MTEPILEARGVGHAFGDAPVLEGVDLSLVPGELCVVLGPNGAGKTTLLRALAGLLRPRSGEVRLGGRRVAELRRREVARRLAVVPQELLVPFPYRVRELVAMGRAPHVGPLGREGPRDRAVVDDAIETLGLSAFAERGYDTLSGGEKQRVVLARALAQEAPALLLDEPTAHMDLGHRVHTFEWLREWVGRVPGERAALVVTHDLILAQHFADRVVLLHRGRVAASGGVEVLTLERIGEVYEVDASLSHDASGRPVIVAARSRIRYTAGPQ